MTGVGTACIAVVVVAVVVGVELICEICVKDCKLSASMLSEEPLEFKIAMPLKTFVHLLLLEGKFVLTLCTKPLVSVCWHCCCCCFISLLKSCCC